MKDDETTDETEMLNLELAMRERLRIDPMALQEEFVRIPGSIAYLGALHGKAVEDNLRARIRSKKLWGLMLMQAREQLEEQNTTAQEQEDQAADKAGRKPKDVKVRITEAQVEGLAHQFKPWQDAQEDEARTERAVIEAKANFVAIVAKKDMLVQMGATERAEMERDPSVRARHRSVQD
jgi:hypothetical protein